jgi:hypothetical protein
VGGVPNRRLGRADEELLEDVPHRRVVSTILKRLRVFFRYDRKLLGELAGCAWRALKLYFEAYFDGARVTPGAVGFVQTAGEHGGRQSAPAPRSTRARVPGVGSQPRTAIACRHSAT